MNFWGFLTTVWPGLRVAQIQVIFAVPADLCQPLIPSHLAYVEWFTHFQSPNPDSCLHSVNRSYCNNSPAAEIIPITSIVSSCYLTPKFGTKYHPARWDTENILDECKSFYLTKHINLDTFLHLEDHFSTTLLHFFTFFNLHIPANILYCCFQVFLSWTHNITIIFYFLFGVRGVTAK